MNDMASSPESRHQAKKVADDIQIGKRNIGGVAGAGLTEAWVTGVILSAGRRWILRKFLVFGGVLLASASAAVSGETTGPRPLGNPGGWVTENDYPPAAMRAGTSGTTRFTLSVDAVGKVSACAVTVTSGSRLLDETTCTLLTARASFTPARDGAGRAIASTFTSSIRWMIPDSDPIPLPRDQSAMQTVQFEVDAGGHPHSCQVEGDAPSWAGVLETVCGRLPSMAMPFAPDPAGGTRHVTITVRLDVSTAPADPEAAAHIISPH